MDTEQTTPRGSQRVGSVDRAMQLLRLGLEREDLGVTEAAVQLGIAPSTAYRLLATMADHGVFEATADRRYRLGDVLVAPRRRRHRVVVLREAVAPLLRRLHDEIGETVHLMVLVGRETQFIDGIEGVRALRIGMRIGGRLPAHCSSGGKAILAALGPATVDRMYRDGLPSWPGQRIASLGELQRELDEVRATGVAFNSGESETDVRALGVAIGPDGESPHGAIAISFPESRFAQIDRARIIRALLAAKKDAAVLCAAASNP
jgi:DNA-binding IclR family transcriptional regulator